MIIFLVFSKACSAGDWWTLLISQLQLWTTINLILRGHHILINNHLIAYTQSETFKRGDRHTSILNRKDHIHRDGGYLMHLPHLYPKSQSSALKQLNQKTCLAKCVLSLTQTQSWDSQVSSDLMAVRDMLMDIKEYFENKWNLIW